MKQNQPGFFPLKVLSQFRSTISFMRIVGLGAFLTLFSLGAFAAPPHFKPVDLREMLESKDSMPDIKGDDFLDRSSVWRPVFRWQSKDKSVGHYPGYSNSPTLTLFGMKVWEVYTRFSNASLTSLEVSLYNRGDAGAMSNENFLPLLKTAKTKIDEWTGVKPSELAKKKLPKNRGIIRRLAWVNGKLIIILQWSSKKLRGSKTLHPEYLKCVIQAFDPEYDPRKTIKSHKAVKNKSLKSNLKTNNDGDLYIDGVPMVDQGSKGYCAVAATERIMRYFGSDVDEHDLAQLAGSSAKGGTNPVEMLKMLKRAGSKLRIKIRVFMKPLDGRSVFKEIGKIDKFFKRKGVSKFGRITSFEEYYRKIKNEFDTYKEYRCVKNKSAYKKFRSNIIKNVNLGLPVQWGVQLGLVREEKNPQAWGGHMRLIIGYNKKTNEIVFTDTWGPGHEFKKMKWDDAWAIATFYSVMMPR
ncbi:MAG: hypothetical protein GXP32_10385 [Kiritimatiellaeota bacterium]|nr:hypothetical protein [Kiritimatiellota bacterium]